MPDYKENIRKKLWVDVYFTMQKSNESCVGCREAATSAVKEFDLVFKDDDGIDWKNRYHDLHVKMSSHLSGISNFNCNADDIAFKFDQKFRDMQTDLLLLHTEEKHHDN